MSHYRTRLAIATAIVAGSAAAAAWGQHVSPADADDPGVPVIEGHRPPPGHARPPFHTHPDVTNTTPAGMSPARIRMAYGFSQVANQGAGQVIAIVDAYDHPNIASDLAVFSNTFGLPACTVQNGCFTKVYASGGRPRTDSGWALEIALDVEWAHAIAPQAKILLVEAKSSSFNDLMRAIDVAVSQGATVVSMSFGGNEFSSETADDSHFAATNVTFLASSGDSGTGAEYPAASSRVIAVGGTTLNADASGNYIGETAWSGSGGGVSAYQPEPSGQVAWPLPYPGKRGIPDVAYNADPASGVAVYSSVSYNGRSGWFTVGGTSAGAPQWAGLFAIANSMRQAAGKQPLNGALDTLYAIGSTGYGTDWRDVTGGTNGGCGSLCTASGGYDYVTGLGSPVAASLIPALVAQP